MSINGLVPIILPTYTMKQVTQITYSIFPSLESIAVFKVVENSNVYHFMTVVIYTNKTYYFDCLRDA